ncbi:MAG: pirin family protein [Flavobacteriales bacterium]|nr:pirin family protein [Flavobacteriales bacterium]MCX7769356.1 pirin family protein [Flavobacteriales bacterium]MDW8410748.1 pirin family protein [Flavobacteriales bacterium]
MPPKIAQIIRSSSRGYRDYGWLRTYHSFSFGDYYHPSYIRFGALRVLNEDIIAPGTGFATHPHKDMEIITLPLAGELRHEDSTGQSGIIKPGQVQVMSAGTGIYHSERNPSQRDALHLLQIWVIPEKSGVIPRYQQADLPPLPANTIFTFLGPKDAGHLLWIHQQSWFSLLQLESGHSAIYFMKKFSNGIYLFIIDGNIQVQDYTLEKGDALASEGLDTIEIQGIADNSRILLMEVPMI